MMITSKLTGLSRRMKRTGAVVAVTLASTAGLVAVGGGVAHAASPYQIVFSTESWLNVGIRGGSTSPGTDAIQWWSDGGLDQFWQIYNLGNQSANYFQNANSRLCLTTDGVAGDPLTQESCSADNVYQQWQLNPDWVYGGYTVYNAATGLNMDVQGASYWGGAEIDAWYPNNGLNQVFDWVDAAS